MHVPMVFGCSVSGTSILEISSVPGAVMITAVSKWRASTPNAMYAAMMPPETCAMPLVMMVISSDCVSHADGSTPTSELRLNMQEAMQENCEVYRTAASLTVGQRRIADLWSGES